MPRICAFARRDLAERLGAQGADRLAPDAARRDETGDAKPLQVVTDQRLTESDVRDELGHAGLAFRQATDDAQPIHVGEGLVKQAQLAQVVGLEDDRGDRGANAGGCRQGWWTPRPGCEPRNEVSAGRRINAG